MWRQVPGEAGRQHPSGFVMIQASKATSKPSCQEENNSQKRKTRVGLCEEMKCTLTLIRSEYQLDRLWSPWPELWRMPIRDSVCVWPCVSVHMSESVPARTRARVYVGMVGRGASTATDLVTAGQNNSRNDCGQSIQARFYVCHCDQSCYHQRVLPFYSSGPTFVPAAQTFSW